MALRVGIDLGTTNSVVSYIKGGRPELVANQQGEYWTPSVVQHRDDEILVGREAKENMPFLPEETIWSIKRFIGRSPGDEELEKARKLVPYRVDDPPPGKADLVVHLGGKTHTPVDISAMILRKLADDTQAALGERPTDAVITVPAYFSERQIEATRRAGKAAGLNVRRVLDEPTAAALAYGLDLDAAAEKTLLVFDLGGGTFDVSILMLTGGQFTTVKITGDNFLGGDDFDNVILERLLEVLGGDASDNRTVRAHLKKQAEMAKIALSTTNVHRVDTFIQADPAKPPLRLSTKLERAWFEQQTRPLVDRAIEQVTLALKKAGMDAGEIQNVLLVGGSSRIPQVQSAVESIFGAAKISKEMNPMLCVAQGAAILAETIGEGRDEASVIATMTAKPRGVELADGAFDPIIPEETYYPMQDPVRQYYKTRGKNQRELRIAVYEGENKVAQKNEWQGDVVVEFSDGLPENTPVTVGLRLDNSGITLVTVDIEGRPNAVKDARVERSNRRPEPKAGAPASTMSSADFAMKYIHAFLGECGKLFRLYPETKKMLMNKLGELAKVIETSSDAEAARAADEVVAAVDREMDGIVQLYFWGSLVSRDTSNPRRSERLKAAVRDADSAIDRNDIHALQSAVVDMKPLIEEALASAPAGGRSGALLGLVKA